MMDEQFRDFVTHFRRAQIITRCAEWRNPFSDSRGSPERLVGTALFAEIDPYPYSATRKRFFLDKFNLHRVNFGTDSVLQVSATTSAIDDYIFQRADGFSPPPALSLCPSLCASLDSSPVFFRSRVATPGEVGN